MPSFSTSHTAMRGRRNRPQNWVHGGIRLLLYFRVYRRLKWESWLLVSYHLRSKCIVLCSTRWAELSQDGLFGACVGTLFLVLGGQRGSSVPFMSPFAALDVIRFHEDKEQVETLRTGCNEWPGRDYSVWPVQIFWIVTYTLKLLMVKQNGPLVSNLQIGFEKCNSDY